ncbi:MAG: oligosaccharide flippase family protein [Actinobacteria bacterium]|nr:oligosaccharide flippase family protein [Actinomycetota bacterium]
MAERGDDAEVVPGQRSAGYRSRTALLFAVSEIVGKLASFGMFAVASRILGPAGFGEYSWALALGAIVASFGMFGFDMALIQLGERNRGRVADYLTSSITLRLLIGAVGVAVIALIPLSNPDARALVIVTTLALSIDNLSTGMRAAASTIDRQRAPAVVIIVQRVVTAVASISMLLLGFGVLAMGIAFLFGTTLGAVSLFVIVTRFGIGPAPRHLHRDSTIDVVRKSILPGLANTMNMQTTRLDIVALERRKDADAVGYFAAAFKLVETSLFISDSLIRSALPEMLYAKDNRRVGEIVRTVLATDAVFYLPVATAMAVRGGDIMAVVFGDEFAAGGPAAAALAIGLLAWVTLGILTTALLVRHYSRDVAVVAGITLAVKFVIVWPLVDAYGAVGAGIAVSVAFTVQASLLWWRLARHGGRPRMGVTLLPAALASAVMAPIAYFPTNFWLAVVLAAAAYVLCWWVFARWFDPGTIARVRSIVGR